PIQRTARQSQCYDPLAAAADVLADTGRTALLGGVYVGARTRAQRACAPACLPRFHEPSRQGLLAADQPWLATGPARRPARGIRHPALGRWRRALRALRSGPGPDDLRCAAAATLLPDAR